MATPFFQLGDWTAEGRWDPDNPDMATIFKDTIRSQQQAEADINKIKQAIDELNQEKS